MLDWQHLQENPCKAGGRVCIVTLKLKNCVRILYDTDREARMMDEYTPHSLHLATKLAVISTVMWILGVKIFSHWSVNCCPCHCGRCVWCVESANGTFRPNIFWDHKFVPARYSYSDINVGVIAKSQKATVSFGLSVKQLGFHWTDFDEILFWIFFRSPVEKVRVSLQSDKNNGYFTWTRFHIYDNMSMNYS
jgi:hypothetical protein